MDNKKAIITSAVAILLASALSYKVYQSKKAKTSKNSLPDGYGLVTMDDLIGNTDDLVCTTGRIKIKG